DLGGLVAAHEDRVEVLVVVRQVDGGLLADWRAVARLALAQVGDQDAETALARLDGAVAWPAFRVAVVQELVQMGRRRDTADLDDARRLLRVGAWRRHNERAQQEKESHRNLLGSTSASRAASPRSTRASASPTPVGAAPRPASLATRSVTQRPALQSTCPAPHGAPSLTGSDRARSSQRAANSPARSPCPRLINSCAVTPSSQPMTSTRKSWSQPRRGGTRVPESPPSPAGTTTSGCSSSVGSTA